MYKDPWPWPKEPKVKPPEPVRGTRITFLGCGTSSGVPLLACACRTCRSRNPKNNRTRASAVVQTGSRMFLIDTTPDLRGQFLGNKLEWIDAVLFTHPHADHIHGIDELRSFNYVMVRSIPCYGNAWTVRTLRDRFHYIFAKTQLGGGKPRITLHELKNPKKIAGVRVQPLELLHGRLPVLGFRINDIAYVTDCSYIPDQTMRRLKGLQILVLDCLRYGEHPTHLTVEKSLALAEKIGAKRTYFTHMGHELEYQAFARSLPRGMYPAYDGLVIET